MKLHRFIRDFNLQTKILEIFDEEIINQVKNVLRLKIGDKIILADGKLNEALAEIREFRKESILVDIVEISQNKNEPVVHAVLYCSILKRENFELVVQKAVEVGVVEIIPLIAERTVKLNLKEERLKKIILEAAEQSGRGRVPILHDVMSFERALDIASQNDVNLFFDVSGSMYNSLKMQHSGRVGIFVGPEGGWGEKEIELAKEKKFQIVSLGKLTLRAETAAIIASYLVNTAMRKP